MSLTRRRVLVAGATFAVAAPSVLRASNAYPNRPIRMIIPWGPGGPVDQIARPLVDRITPILGQPIVIENRPGAQGQIGTLAVARADPDGYTILCLTAAHIANQVLYAKLPYHALNDFEGVTMLARSDGSAMVSRPSLPAKDVREFVALAKASPGKFSFGHPGVGTPTHISGELLKHLAGIDILAVPYKGGAGAYITDLISGHVDVGFMSTLLAIPNIQSGNVKLLATTGRRRLPAFPQVPTMAEAGYSDFVQTGYFGVWAPKGTPQDRLETLSRAATKVLNMSDMKDLLAAAGLEIAGTTPAQFKRDLDEDYARQRAIMARIGLQPQ